MPPDNAPDPVGVDLPTPSVEQLRSAYKQHGSSVLLIAQRVVGERPLAEDVTQEIFVRLWKSPGFFEEAAMALRTRLLGQARSYAIELWRAHAVRLKHEGRNGRFVDLPAGLRDEAALASSAADVRQALAQLPGDQREPILLAYFGGLTCRQVAAVLEIPEATTRSRIRAGLHGLRKQLVANPA